MKPMTLIRTSRQLTARIDKDSDLVIQFTGIGREYLVHVRDSVDLAHFALRESLTEKTFYESIKLGEP